MSKTITALQLQKKNKARVNVFLDGEYAFALNLDAALPLKKGERLSAAQIDALRSEDERQVAYQRALHFLGYRQRSRAEVEANLREKGYHDAIIAHVLQRLADEQLVNDAAFAEFWVENREQFRPRSVRALRYELRQKGLSSEVIDQAVAGIDEEGAAWAVVEGKIDRWATLEPAEFQAKVMGLLGRRGFSFAIARRVSRRAWSSLGNRDDETFDEA
jgi:regulatory protein